MKRLHLLGVAALTVLAACGSDSSGPGGGSSFEYAGSFGSSLHSGTIVISKASSIRSSQAGLRASATNVTATLKFLNQTETVIDGTLDGDALALIGSGYSFAGTLAGKTISGSYTGPGGETGYFSVTLDSSGRGVAAYRR